MLDELLYEDFNTTPANKLMKNPVKVITVVLGVLMFLPGLNKLFEPAKTKLHVQLTLAEVPFTMFTYWLAILGELAVGSLLVILPFIQSRLNPTLRQNLFNLGHLVVTVMMIVAIYVHVHPAVPADVLPLAKPPYMPIAYLLIVSVNLYLYRKNARIIHPHLNHGD